MAFIGGGSSSAKQSASKIPEIGEVSQDITQSYLKNLPEILNFLQQWSPELQKTLLANTIETAPVISAQERDNLAQTGKTERELNALGFEQALGQQAAQSAQNRTLNPVLGSTADALKNLMSPNLSGSELSNIERGTNRQFLNSGTFNTPGRVQELEAAINYGNAGRDRILQGVNAASGATNLLSGLTPGLNYAPKNISPEFSKIDTDLGTAGTKMLFTNPVEAATNAYTAAIGNQTPKSKESSTEASV